MDAGPLISIFLPDLRMGGAERVSLQLAAGFAGKGCRVQLVLLKRGGQLAAEVPGGVEVVELGASREYWALAVMTAYLRKHRPAVAYSTLDLTSCLLVVANRLAGSPSRVVVCQSSTVSKIQRSKIKKILEKYLLRLIFPAANRIVAVSKGAADDLATYTGISRQRIQAIYNPIITPAVMLQMNDPVKEDWFAPGQPPVILAVGRLTVYKDYPTLLKAFVLLRKKIACRLIILGDGELRTELEAEAVRLGIEKDVILPGFFQNPYPYMRRASLFVLSSIVEGLPSVLVQALACGCPVVSTDCPSGPAEILDGGKYGTLTPVGDADALAEAMEAVLRYGGKTVPHEWLNQFEEETVIRQYLDLFGISGGE